MPEGIMTRVHRAHQGFWEVLAVEQHTGAGATMLWWCFSD